MSVPAERIWTIDIFHQDPQTGEWFPDEKALPNALLELIGIMTRVGGVFQMGTRRYEIAPGRIETVGVVIRWRSFAPVEKGGADQVAPPVEQDGAAAQAAAEPLAEPPDLPPRDEPAPSAPDEQVSATQS